ncbi:hypothetical protein HS088_TW09G00909 [Tripterygium wilfordii]|uniref:Uncharacterized protein ycf33 n=1 Tax=Tripterygium wilfordii TaxID=458696 RepID=A0A7J7D980_TRIWF|nr:uncharacterized protein LOC120006555 [Tripterygium wilfordii]KAF5742848.1 hypothetical protein HS088_TW09G00909 [Tripterygium wilfordii]
MTTFPLRSSLNFPRFSNVTNPIPNSPFLIPIKTKRLSLEQPIPASISSANSNSKRTRCLEVLKPRCQKHSKSNPVQVSSNGYSRFVAFGAVSVGFALLLMAIDDQKALAFGPEGPLVEEFWENVRRYGLYALTVSTGAIYTIVQPIFELLKNPISAVLVLIIFVGGIFIVSQVLSAMVGISSFSYEYGY